MEMFGKHQMLLYFVLLGMTGSELGDRKSLEERILAKEKNTEEKSMKRKNMAESEKCTKLFWIKMPVSS